MIIKSSRHLSSAVGNPRKRLILDTSLVINDQNIGKKNLTISDNYPAKTTRK
jgi:hypothetical protein